ncbi:MAG: UDP-N-acetylmuramoyl-tripeptide--D-alanyl-D-alanine ligase [Candidatus Accumulibacter sp.]|jgi:UDP-N-acetylmuramoyl-tripeptide--D-alanyl-D-alanine ligase|nr:UDP-N-acetylmuramoyl-tripeptide--D-alanyl-D-alanine ligase [Accumulibacter sp.]
MSARMDLADAARAMSGSVEGAGVAFAAFAGVSTDSRALRPGELFVALRGKRFDGHEFIEAACECGAAAAVVDAAGAEASRVAAGKLPLVVVADTRLALGDLAACWRARFTLPLIGVTGSNGKTTNKEMITSILKAAFGEGAVLATNGNLNNDIGLPLTLLGLDGGHRAAVVEMGMNHPGEIAYLAAIGRPTVALVTNAQRAHLEGMGTLDVIAAEKGGIFSGLDRDGVAVFNADDPWADLWRAQSAHCRRRCFSLGGEAEVSGQCQTHGLENRVSIAADGERIEVDLALPGVHNARNALGAAAAALAAGVPLAAVRQGLADFRGIRGRLQRRAGRHGALVLDDTYNANPDSVRAGIDVLAATIGRKILVLGDMGEIGEMTGQFHDEIGGYAKSQGIDRLLAFGESSALAALNFGVGGEHFRKFEDLAAALLAELAPESIVLVKGSRFMRMERVIDAITAQEGEGPSCC